MAAATRALQSVVARCRRSLGSFCARDRGSISGTAAIEFAIVATILAVMAMGVLDAGIGLYRKMQVQDAAQAGAYYAMNHGYVPAAITTAVTAATKYSQIAASPAPRQYCGCPSTVGIADATCGTTCADGLKAPTYVEISAQATYRTIFVYPLLSDTFTLTAVSTVRLP
jgi:Flp pilus assembly protein TadG